MKKVISMNSSENQLILSAHNNVSSGAPSGPYTVEGPVANKSSKEPHTASLDKYQAAIANLRYLFEKSGEYTFRFGDQLFSIVELTTSYKPTKIRKAMQSLAFISSCPANYYQLKNGLILLFRAADKIKDPNDRQTTKKLGWYGIVRGVGNSVCDGIGFFLMILGDETNPLKVVAISAETISVITDVVATRKNITDISQNQSAAKKYLKQKNEIKEEIDNIPYDESVETLRVLERIRDHISTQHVNARTMARGFYLTISSRPEFLSSSLVNIFNIVASIVQNNSSNDSTQEAETPIPTSNFTSVTPLVPLDPTVSFSNSSEWVNGTQDPLNSTFTNVLSMLAFVVIGLKMLGYLMFTWGAMVRALNGVSKLSVQEKGVDGKKSYKNALRALFQNSPKPEKKVKITSVSEQHKEVITFVNQVKDIIDSQDNDPEHMEALSSGFDDIKEELEKREEIPFKTLQHLLKKVLNIVSKLDPTTQEKIPKFPSLSSPSSPTLVLHEAKGSKVKIGDPTKSFHF